jgi:hypothetical protein
MEAKEPEVPNTHREGTSAGWGWGQKHTSK